MLWNELYEKRNDSDELFWPLRKYVEDAQEIPWVHSIDIQRSSTLRSQEGWGFYYRKIGPEMPKICDEFVILIASDHDDLTIDKIVSIKEIMHCYENKYSTFVDTPEKLEKLINHFYGRPLLDAQDHFINSEPTAYWRAVSVITTETERERIKRFVIDADDQDAMINYWAWELKTPNFIVEALVSDIYEHNLEQIKQRPD